MRLRAALAGAIAVWALGACAALADAPGAPATLRPANLKPEPNSIEAGLWDGADRAEDHIKNSAELDPDPAMQAYARSVFCRIAAEYCGEARVYVLDRPVLNATCMPNGYVEVWSGLLLRAQTEDELAYVLGHEVTHFARNHSLQRWNKDKARSDATLVVNIGIEVAKTVAMYKVAQAGIPNSREVMDDITDLAQRLENLAYLQGMARFFAFSRENESEADSLGLQRAIAAGYDKSAGSDIWADTIAESEASDFPAVRKSEARASAFMSHPLTRDRVTALTAQIGGTATPPELEARRRYRAVIRGHLDPWLRDDLRRRDFGQTLFLIDRLSGLGEDIGVLQFYRGEAYRQRRKDGDAALALAAYRASVDQPDAPVAAWRELGEALRKSGDKAAAAQAFETYLAKAPAGADDRWVVEASLKSLKGT